MIGDNRAVGAIRRGGEWKENPPNCHPELGEVSDRHQALGMYSSGFLTLFSNRSRKLKSCKTVLPVTVAKFTAKLIYNRDPSLRSAVQ